MNYQALAKRTIQATLTIMLVFFAWVSYHQMMGGVSMETMADHQVSPIRCLTLCFIAAKVDMNEVVQSVYYSFTSSVGTIVVALALSAVGYLAWYYVRYRQFNRNRIMQRFRWYYRQQRSRYKLFFLWQTLYQQGIIAPQVYS